MKINNDKTKVIHFRKKSTKITDVTFQLGEHHVKKVDNYTYLGVYLHEYLDYQTIANTFSGAAGRALGNVISKFKSFGNVGLKTYSKLYHSGVVPILDNCTCFGGFQKRDTCNKVQQSVLRYVLGIHSKTPILALDGDTGWLNTEVRRHTEIFRFWNHIITMDPTNKKSVCN